MQNLMISKKSGFTLVEIMTVLAIIAILFGILIVIMMRSDKSKIASMQSSAKSIMPFVQECAFNEQALAFPASPNDDGGGSGDKICSGSITEWPALAVDGCVYEDAGGYSFRINCDSAGISEKVFCNPESNCAIEN